MSLSIGQQHDLYKLAVGVYQAAPGTLYLNMLSDSLLAGASMAQLYERLAAHPSFQGQHADYGDSASDAQFVRRFVENLVADGALAADKDAIAAHFAGLLPGSSRGAIMKLAIDLLDAVPESDATWGRAAALLHNRIEAARYYTETLQGSGTDLAVLRTTIATVTSDDASVSAANQANAAVANGSVPGTGSTAPPASSPAAPEVSDAPGGAGADVPAAGGSGEPSASGAEGSNPPASAGTPEAGASAPAGNPANTAVPRDDTVIVADHSVLSLNARADSNAEDLDINSYLNYDLVNADDVSDRLSLAELRAGEEALGGADAPQACNIGQFTFDLGAGQDRVDYSNETARIASVVNFNPAHDTQSVLIDGNNSGQYDDAIADRVDRLVGVENIVASRGESILDLTNSTVDLAIAFSRQVTAANGYNVHRVELSNLDTDIALGMNFLEYRDNNPGDSAPDVFAVWNTIEGSDHDEKTELTDAETQFDHIFHLRGGDNEVNYNELTRSINASINIIDFDPNHPTTTGQVQAEVLFTNGNPGIIIGGEDVISSYSAQNEIAPGSLRIEASQDAEDSVSFAADLTKLFVLGEVVNHSDQITVIVGEPGAQDSIALTGFEVLLDASSNDVYTMDDLQRVVNNLALTDNAIDDTDAVLVFDDAVGFQAAPPHTLSLEVLNDAFAFDFDILDVTEVTDDHLLLVGDTDGARDLGSDAVRVGNLDLLDDVTLFQAIIFADASVASAGDEFVIDIDHGEFEDGGGHVLFTFDAALTVFDFSEVDPDTHLAVSVIDTAGVGVTVVGATIVDDGDDTIIGGAGDDTLTGGSGADVMDGGIAAEVRQFEFFGIADAVPGQSFSFDFMSQGNLTLTEAAVADNNYTDGAGAVVNGAGSDAFGAALAALLNGNLAQVNADWIAGGGDAGSTIAHASYSAVTNLLSFTFGAGVDVAAAIDLGISDGDTGTFAVSAEATAAQGGDGGSDTFVYTDSADSTSSGMDRILHFSIDAASGADDVIDLSAFGLAASVASGGNSFNFATGAIVFGANSTFYASNGTDARVYVDVNDNNGFGTGDLVIELAGVADVSGITAPENFAF